MLNHFRLWMSRGSSVARDKAPAHDDLAGMACSHTSSSGATTSRASSLGSPDSRASSFHQSLKVDDTVERSVKPNHQEATMPSLLLQAASEGHASLVRRIATRENVQERHPLSYCDPKLGMTPLLAAVLSKNLDTVRAVLACSPDVNEPHAVIGYTVLMYATNRYDIAMIKLLLAAGADPHIEGFDGSTAYSIAKSAAEESVEGREMLALFSPSPASAIASRS